ncbi:MAG: YIP1 family protein [Halobacteriales archaeon]|nr:YIP1 family protein [Halobacteriales archaeon]
MTTWVENPEGGRERGARALVRAWIELLTHPRRFFHNGISPGDQAPGLSFVIVISFCYTATRFLTVPASRPGFFASEPASVLVGLLLATFLIGPVGLHLVAALQVVLTIAFVRDRGGVSKTVQVLAYATAPMALAGVGVPPMLAGTPFVAEVVAAWRVGLALWGCGLLVVGMATVHEISVFRAVVVVAIPAIVVFGYFFGGLYSLETLVGINIISRRPPTGEMETQLLDAREPSV